MDKTKILLWDEMEAPEEDDQWSHPLERPRLETLVLDLWGEILPFKSPRPVALSFNAGQPLPGASKGPDPAIGGQADDIIAKLREPVAAAHFLVLEDRGDPGRGSAREVILKNEKEGRG